MSATTAFDRAIALDPAGDGSYRALVDPAWNAPMGPNGGYLAALAVRALESELDPAGERQIRSLTLHYLRRPADGPLDLRVEPVRSGRRMATARVSGLQDGKEVLAGIGALAVPDLPEVEVWSPSPPPVDPPPAEGGRDWLRWREGTPDLMQRLRFAPRIGRAPFSGAGPEAGKPPTTGGWLELAEPRVIDTAFLALATDVWWPPSFGQLDTPAGAPTVDMTIHFRADVPRAGLPAAPVLGVFTSTASGGGFVEEDGMVFALDGTLLAQSRQLALLVPLP